jgi:thiol:disulfide interchange protein DsbD
MTLTHDPLTWLGIYLSGLALNLTPCVYPLLSVTVSLFRTQGGASRQQIFLKAVCYVFGMATMYSTLGVVAALSGGFFGEVLQKPIIQLAIALFLFVLALSMLGVYTLQPPLWLMSRLSGRRQANYMGLYLSGLFVGIFAAPCIGPPVIALLTYVGTLKDPVYGFLTFFVLSLGLGTPYLVLATLSGGLDKLPKSGAWLVWVERLFGVILIAFSVFYVLLALHPAGLKWLLPLALGLGGVYLGFVEKAGNNSSFFRQLKHALGVAAVGVAIAMVVIHPVKKSEGISWERFSQARLEQVAREGKYAMVDFYADWCIPCHEMDKTTFQDGRIIAALSKIVCLKADMTNNSSPEVKQWIAQWKVVGVPTTLFIDKSGAEKENLRSVGYTSADDMLEKLKSLQASAS